MSSGQILREGQTVWEADSWVGLGGPHHSEMSDQILRGKKHQVKKFRSNVQLRYLTDEWCKGGWSYVMLSLCPSREISESMSLQNPKGSLLNTSGTVLSPVWSPLTLYSQPLFYDLNCMFVTWKSHCSTKQSHLSFHTVALWLQIRVLN